MTEHTEPMPRVHVVILNWNGWKDTVECLESVFRQDYPNYQVVVCDNDSADGSLDKIQAWAKGDLPAEVDSAHPLARLSRPGIGKPLRFVRTDRVGAEGAEPGNWGDIPLLLIETGGNLGFAGGNNVGIRYSLRSGQCDYIWLLNNDTVVEPDALTRMVEHSGGLRATGRPNTCGSLVCFYEDPEVIQALGGSHFNPRTGIAAQTAGRFRRRSEAIDHTAVAAGLDYISGCSWLIPMDYITEVGLLDDGYFLYYEEIDWVTRAGRQWALAYAPNARVYHKEGNSIGSKTINRGPTAFSDYQMTVSKIRFSRRHYPRRIVVYVLFSVAIAVNRVLQGRARNGLQILKGCWAALTVRT